MALHKNKEVKKYCGIVEVRISVDCNDDFVEKKWRKREVKVD